MLYLKALFSVLIVSGSQKGTDFVTEILDSNIFTPISCAKGGAEARRMMSECEYDIVIINTPLTDEFGHELALHAAEKASGTILLVKNEIFDEVCSRVEDSGVLTISKPVSRQLFYQTAKLIIAQNGRLANLERENRKLLTKLQEQTVISRAKCVLIEVLHMTESQAHHYIEKQSMDMRTTKAGTAEDIIRTYCG